MTDNDYFYGSWKRMFTRCYDPRYHSYHRYGGRGIEVCEDWHSYANFKSDMWPTWKRGLSLDRIDNDGDYCLPNCRWLPKNENSKPFKIDPQKLLEEYNSGENQYQLAEKYHTFQPHISRLLVKARRGAKLR